MTLGFLGICWVFTAGAPESKLLPADSPTGLGHEVSHAFRCSASKEHLLERFTGLQEVYNEEPNISVSRDYCDMMSRQGVTCIEFFAPSLHSVDLTLLSNCSVEDNSLVLA